MPAATTTTRERIEAARREAVEIIERATAMLSELDQELAGLEA